MGERAQGNTGHAGGTAPVVMQVAAGLVGAARGPRQAAAAVAAAGWTSIVAAPQGPGIRRVLRTGAEHLELALDAPGPLARRRIRARLAQLAQDRGAGIVHLWGAAASCLPAAGPRTVITHYGTQYAAQYGAQYGGGLGGAIGGAWAGRALRRTFRQCDRVMALSGYAARRAAENGVGEERIVVIPGALDTATYDPAAVTVERLVQLSQTWDVPDGEPVVALIGAAGPDSGHELMIEALAALGRPDVLCLLVDAGPGEAPWLRRAEARVRQLGLEGRVRRVDSGRDLPAAYMLADVVVSAPGGPEIFARTAVEAQAMGRPVVAPRHGAVTEAVIDGVTGWLVRPGDAEAMAWGLRTALALDGEARAALAAKARAYTLRNNAMDAVAQRLVAFYGELLGLSEGAGKDGESAP